MYLQHLLAAYLGRFGIVPTRTTDFQVMFLFSMGITKGKRDTLDQHLVVIQASLRCKRRSRSDSTWASCKSTPEAYKGLGLKDLGNKMFEYLVRHNPGQVLNNAYSSLPEMELKPRDCLPDDRV